MIPPWFGCIVFVYRSFIIMEQRPKIQEFYGRRNKHGITAPVKGSMNDYLSSPADHSLLYCRVHGKYPGLCPQSETAARSSVRPFLILLFVCHSFAKRANQSVISFSLLSRCFGFPERESSWFSPWNRQSPVGTPCCTKAVYI